MSPLEHHSVSSLNSIRHEALRIRDVPSQTVGIAGELRMQGVIRKGLAPHHLQKPVLNPEHVLEPAREQGGVHELTHADADPGNLVLVGRADAPGRGADPVLASRLFFERVEHSMVRKNHMSGR